MIWRIKLISVNGESYGGIVSYHVYIRCKYLERFML